MPSATPSPLARDERTFVRLSLRLLTTARLIERRVDQLMRARFGASLSRFDFMAALDRHGALTLSAISENLLVSNGNVTALTARLRADGLIETVQCADDRRTQTVRLTAKGRTLFRKMAKAHASTVAAMLSTVPANARMELGQLLDDVRTSVRRSLSEEDAA
ncbi:MAG: MarR family winged helix-turn-helix transcriptional regulator [Hyphomonadaceae bacterium]